MPSTSTPFFTDRIRKPATLKRVKKWIEALESGEYEKGKGALRASGAPVDHSLTYCCLGVACDIWNPHEWRILQDSDNFYNHPLGAPLRSGDRAVGRLPENCSFLSRKGLSLYALTPEAQGRLAMLNDNSNSYKPIIKLLKAELAKALA